MSATCDLVILGSGTSAFAGAIKAAEMGARVTLVEQSQLGGTCVNWGCVPSKTLIDKAAIYFHARRGAAFGVRLEAAPPDCQALMAAKKSAVDTVRQGSYQRILEQMPGISVRRGHGRFLSPRELQVGPEVLRSEKFLVACGGVPRTLRLPGLAETDYLTSYSALHLNCFPRSLLMLGGGVIALEMGQMLRRFGTEVTVVERGDRLLKDFDPRLTGIYQRLVEAEGMAVHVGAEAKRVSCSGGECSLEVEVGGEKQTLRAERLMLAIGTAPATAGIGLEEAGVELDEAGFIRTDPEMRTTAENIWAAGDCTGPPLIAPAGAREAEIAVENLLDPAAHRQIDHRHTPMVVFTDPEFAGVGLSAAGAAAAGYEPVETFLDLATVAKAHVLGRPEGGILLTSEKGSGRLLGVEMLAPRAADVIHEAVLAVRLGLTVNDLAATVHAYPTISDGLRLAALKNLHQQKGGGEAISPWHPST